MKTERIGYLLVMLVAIFVLSSAALSAQNVSAPLAQATAEATAEGAPVVIFDDQRVNNAVILGEFGIFCEDLNGNPSGSYAGGRIAVYGSNGEQYLFVEEPALTQYTMGAMTDMTGTEEPTMMPTNTLRANQTPTSPAAILLAQAQATQGPVMLFLTGDNEFSLRGFLPDGTPFAYNWVGCTGGTEVEILDATEDFNFVTTTPVPTLSDVMAQPTTRATLRATLSATTEVTAEATTSP